MDKDFWQTRWATREIAFHAKEANTLLVNYVQRLGLADGGRVFLPLCGKTRDIAWLLAGNFQVVGIELVETAVVELFAELEREPTITDMTELRCYSAHNIDIFVGDFFALSDVSLGAVDAVYDRAALVALPQPMRDQYTVHLTRITSAAPQLLITFEYDQRQVSGPPFSISRDEVCRQYSARYDVTLLESLDVPGGLKGKCPATESAWLLNAKENG